MRLSAFVSHALLSLALPAQALNILLSNDDGFGSGNLREVYRLLKQEGHNRMSTIKASSLPPIVDQLLMR